MAILTVNGVGVANPSSFSVDIMDLSSEESGRLLNGEMTKDLIARKRKLNCSWNTLTWSEVSQLLTTVQSSIDLSVTYPDPQIGSYVTKTFYVGDRSAPAVWLHEGKEYWGGTAFNFIEK